MSVVLNYSTITSWCRSSRNYNIPSNEHRVPASSNARPINVLWNGPGVFEGVEFRLFFSFPRRIENYFDAAVVKNVRRPVKHVIAARTARTKCGRVVVTNVYFIDLAGKRPVRRRRITAKRIEFRRRSVAAAQHGPGDSIRRPKPCARLGI